jgi:hypothetical protein
LHDPFPPFILFTWLHLRQQAFIPLSLGFLCRPYRIWVNRFLKQLPLAQVAVDGKRKEKTAPGQFPALQAEQYSVY